MKWVQVKFPGTIRVYSYLYTLDKKVEEGDYLVVDSPYHGPTIVKCLKVFNSDPPEIATKHILHTIGELEE